MTYPEGDWWRHKWGADDVTYPKKSKKNFFSKKSKNRKFIEKWKKFSGGRTPQKCTQIREWSDSAQNRHEWSSRCLLSKKSIRFQKSTPQPTQHPKSENAPIRFKIATDDLQGDYSANTTRHPSLVAPPRVPPPESPLQSPPKLLVTSRVPSW